MCVCIYLCAHTHTHIYVCIHIHINVDIHTYTCMHSNISELINRTGPGAERYYKGYQNRALAQVLRSLSLDSRERERTRERGPTGRQQRSSAPED